MFDMCEFYPQLRVVVVVVVIMEGTAVWETEETTIYVFIPAIFTLRRRR